MKIVVPIHLLQKNLGIHFSQMKVVEEAEAPALVFLEAVVVLSQFWEILLQVLLQAGALYDQNHFCWKEEVEEVVRFLKVGL